MLPILFDILYQQENLLFSIRIFTREDTTTITTATTAAAQPLRPGSRALQRMRQHQWKDLLHLRLLRRPDLRRRQLRFPVPSARSPFPGTSNS